MKEGNEILQELLELKSPLALLPRTMPYYLPESYIDQLAANLVKGVISGEAGDPQLNLSKEMPFDVPEGYLSNLPQVLASEASTTTLKANIPTPFEVAPGYFDTLPANLLRFAKAADSSQSKARNIRFLPYFKKRTIQWAAAAVLLLSISLGSYQYIQYHSPDAVASRLLIQIDGDDLGGYVEQHVDEFDSESLEKAVASTKADLPASLSTLDEEEIQNYLNQTGDTNTSNLN